MKINEFTKSCVMATAAASYVVFIVVSNNLLLPSIFQGYNIMCMYLYIVFSLTIRIRHDDDTLR